MPSSPPFSPPLLSIMALLLLFASLLAPSSQCGDCCCGCGDSNDALLMALLGGTSDLSLGRRKRGTASASTMVAANGGGSSGRSSVEKPKAPPKFRFGKDDPTPHLMGWPIHAATQLKPAKGSVEAEWYRWAFAEEKDRQRAKARMEAAATSRRSWRRQRRLAGLVQEAVERAIRLRKEAAGNADEGKGKEGGGGGKKKEEGRKNEGNNNRW